MVKMTEQEKHWFEALSKDRSESADVHDKPSERGYWKSVVDKYSETAHFVYELLQNADDCKATKVRFILSKDGLFFVHDGKVRFTVTNPDPLAETEDTRNNKLGHINSICSIGNSTKTEQAIGKFGLGFKSIFQFTQTPHIYDRDFQFAIRRFIVPSDLNDAERNIFEKIKRKENETAFWFPFDHEKYENINEVTCLKKRNYFETWNNRQRIASEAYSDIGKKLKSLIHPTLFLSNLEEIIWQSESENGKYKKEIIETYSKNEIEYALIESNHNKLWVFSKTIAIDNYEHRIYVGFYIDENNKLIETPQKSGDEYYLTFCYFPVIHTNTQLKFIIHAPFLLNDSRDAIDTKEPALRTNQYLINHLADLVADSLPILKDLKLIDDSIINVIPYKASDFNDSLFKPFFEKIKEKFQTEELLPARDANYVKKENAYWFQDNPVVELFEDKHLQQLTGNQNAKWVFNGLPRNKTDEEKEKSGYNYIYPKRQYIEECVVQYFEMDVLLRKLGNVFIESQDEKWLHKLYEYLNRFPDRAKTVRKSPIFFDKNSHAVPARDSNDEIVLFLPDNDISGYITIKPSLLENPVSCEFIKSIGVNKPILKDEIYNKIIPEYRSSNVVDIDSHFVKFFKYFKECKNKAVLDLNFINTIKDLPFLHCKTAVDGKINPDKANNIIYMPTEDIKAWFENKPDTKFLCQENYIQIVGEGDKTYLDDFFRKLGVHYLPNVFPKDLSREQVKNIGLQQKGNWGNTYTDKYIDGLSEFFTVPITPEKSHLLWRVLLELKTTSWAQGDHQYHIPRTQGYTHESFDSIALRKLRSERWILTKDDSPVSTSEITIPLISDKYDITSLEARELLRFLDIHENNLTDEQRKKIEFANAFEDIPPEVLRQAAEQYRAKKIRNESGDTGNVENGDEETNEQSGKIDIGNVIKEESKRIPVACAVNDIVKRAFEPSSIQVPIFADDEDDAENYQSPPVNFDKEIEKAKKRGADEIKKIIHLEELRSKAIRNGKYTFGWFKTLLELESLNSGENNAQSREISISFTKVERESGTTRTLILKHPNRYIPHSMEDLADIPLELRFANQAPVKVAVEVINVKSYTLRVKLKTGAEIYGVDLSIITEARIEARNPIFLIEELKKAFADLGFDDDYDLQANLCENIEFIFGPPGTGKTTYLAKNIILPIMRNAEDLKVLVLTPTNKAADVLTSRIMETMNSDDSYKDWLVRFGTTNDNVIEQSGVYRDKTFDIRSFPRNITVTTIARFPYDYFMPETSENKWYRLKELKWDYIIIDEASMIPLANIIYPLYKKTPQKFIVAGDPFQIEPISQVDLWKDENIYTMVKLNSFTEPSTIPHNYHVELLTMQYRSIPEIGDVFSNFAYGGILRHYRTSESRKPFITSDMFDIKSLNIIKFPVSKYESIYRSKRLQSKSSYHVYSALFAFEFVKWLFSHITIADKNESLKIGIIAPYRAQSDIIDKLFSTITPPNNIEIQVGTIHGFQGDECDVIITVFNPPPSISAHPEMFLNKRNIINVSISRARDYLFVIMPDDETESVQNLQLVKKVEMLCKRRSSCSENASNNLEKIIFGSESYIEDNSFSTSHQQVNVYAEPELRYEIRSEETAVDMQIHLER
jgi:hypothetical protein